MTQIVAKGYNGTVSFDGAFVTISRTGALARMSIGKGEKRIPVASISAVQWKKPGPLVNGFISFTLAGAVEKQSRLGSQTSDAGRDENSVIVRRNHIAEFDELRSAVESTMVTGRSTPSGADDLLRLADLRDRGALTEAEFSAAKAKALGL